MIIDYIKMKGYRSYFEEVTFNFDKGINVIIGANGAGKTTALKALRLLLLDKSDATLEEFVNRDSNSFNIEMKFEHLGHSYLTSLDYTLKSKSSERELYIDDFETPKYNTTSSVKDYLKTIFDPDLTYYAIALHQGSSEIIKAKDSARLELFKKIRNVDFNKQAEDIKVEYDRLLKEDLNSLDLQLIALDNKTYNFTETTNLPYTTTEIEDFHTKIEILLLKISNLDQKKEIEKALEDYKIKLQNINFATITLEISSLKEKLGLLANIHFTQEEGEISDLETKQFESRQQQIEDEYTEDKDRIDRTIKALDNQIINVDIKRIRLLDFSEELLEKVKLRDESEFTIAQIKKTIESLKSGVCPTCGKEATIKDIDTYNQDLQANEANLIIVEANVQIVMKTQQENATEVRENDALKEKKQNLQTSLEATKVTLLRLTEDYERALLADEKHISNEVELNKVKIEQAKNSLETDQRILERDIESNNALLGKVLLQQTESREKEKELEETITKTEEKLSKFPDTSIFDLNLEKELLDKKIESQKDVIARNTLIEENNIKLRKESENDALVKFSFLKDKDIINNKVLLLKEARTILLKHFPNYIISASIEDTENSMNDFINTVYDKELNIALRSTATSLKMEYGKGRKLSCSNLSGAEEVLTSLAFINSLNEQLELGFLFMDEADAPLSKANTTTLFDAIQNMNYQQTIIITHQDEFKSALEVEGAKVFEVFEGGIK